jgi:hypothetical protein
MVLIKKGLPFLASPLVQIGAVGAGLFGHPIS